jgi:hypothetical protein
MLLIRACCLQARFYVYKGWRLNRFGVFPRILGLVCIIAPYVYLEYCANIGDGSDAQKRIENGFQLLTFTNTHSS